MTRHRLALYSPGMVGLGHMRRNLLIAQSLSSAFHASVLLVAEAREAAAFAMPPGADCLTLPALRKDPAGDCRPRHLDVPVGRVLAVRSRTIEAALRAFDPDLLVVDHLPLGAGGELTAALKSLKARGRVRCVLGLRDVLEAPEVVSAEWRSRGYESAIETHYSAVWVYGDPAVYDPIQEYGLARPVTEKFRFTGYLDTRIRLQSMRAEGEHLLASLGVTDAARVALCLVGGGADGGPLAEAFLQTTLPPDTFGIVVTGPFMPSETCHRLYQLANTRPRRRVLEFVTEPTSLVNAADWIVTMGGYNNVCDVLSFQKRALIVPRTGPRSEQLIRAERLRDRGLIDVLLPDATSPRVITDWFARARSRPVDVRSRLDLNGLMRLPVLVAELLTAGRASPPLRAPAAAPVTAAL